MTRPLSLAALLLILGACQPPGVAMDKDDTGETEADADADADADTDTDTDTDTGDTTPPVDADGDGFTEDEDCDDTDPTINPDADEVEGDGVDNDCDGLVDETMVCPDGIAPYEVIQEAITAASDGDALEVCPGTWYENLAIIGKQITIGSTDGPEVTIVDGGAATVLNVANVGGDGASVRGLTFRNGASTTYGGGVVCNNATLELVDNVIADNEAPSGAGLVASSCSLTITANSFEDNTATTNGGGAYLYQSRGDITGNLFQGNLANNGGGLYTYGNGVTISENEFRDNYVAVGENETAFGGGLFAYGSITATDNDFIDNESEDDGGAVYIYYSGGEFTGNLVQGNICHNDGAGVYSSVSSTYFADNTFEDNEAYDDAGGLRIYYGSSLIENNTLIGNVANDDGGGMKMSHSADNDVRNCYFEGNVTGDAGGGIELDNETSPVTESVFIDNHAYRGGGLHLWRNEHGTSDLSYLEFEGNSAEDCGGAISSDNNYYPAFVHNSVFTNNTANDGAAFCSDEVWWDSDDDDKADTFHRNEVHLANLVIYDNEVDDDGGAFYLKVTDGNIENVSIWGTAAAGSGSVLAVKGESVITVVNTIMAEASGDEAIYVEDKSSVAFAHSDLYDVGTIASGMEDPVGSDGNIAEDPRFVDPSAGDLALEASSPCIDAGHPSTTDPDGSAADMGAYGGQYGNW